MKGLEKIKQAIPDFQMADFGMFDKIETFEWKKEPDSESWGERRIAAMKMISYDGRYAIWLKFIGVGSCQLYLSEPEGQTCGFYIYDNTNLGYERCNRYKIGDYEEECIEFYCEEIEVLDFRDSQC